MLHQVSDPSRGIELIKVINTISKETHVYEFPTPLGE